MLSVDIPGRGRLELEYLVLDFNGTIAYDGKLIPTVIPLIEKLGNFLEIHVVTSDTHGTVREQCENLPVVVERLVSSDHTTEKKEYVQSLGLKHVAAIGNGYNDAKMLKHSILSILVVGPEGCSKDALLNAQIIVNKIEDALELFIYPKRLIATLRG